MGEKSHNLRFRLLPTALVTGVVLTAVAVAVSPDRNDVATYWGFVAGVAGLALAVLALRQAKKHQDETPTLRELDKLADRLAETVEEQWEKEAGARSLLTPIPVQWRLSSTMAVDPSVAVKSKLFEPLPGLDPIDEQFLQNGGGIDDLHAVYGGLRSGRLVIAGGPGSGKTGAAIWLVLAALRYRKQLHDNQRPQVPVPVLFAVREWDPVNQPIQDWLISQLQQTYPVFADEDGRLKAAELIAAKKVAVILDGLDDLATTLRPAALKALSQQATSFRVVALARTDEMVSAASQQVLKEAAAVELQRIDAEVAADYLTSGKVASLPDAWRELVDRIRSEQGSPLAQALSTPLTLTLARDTCQSEEDVLDLLAISDATDGSDSDEERVKRIKDHLLDGLIFATYAPGPGRPLKYDAETAHMALLIIATAMKREGTYNLEWWRLPLWFAPGWRMTTACSAVGVLTCLVIWSVFGLGSGLFFGFMTGVAAFWATVTPGRKPKRTGNPPWKTGKIRLRWALSGVPFKVLVGSGLVFAPVGGLLGRLAIGNVIGIVLGILAGLALALVFGLVFALPQLGDPGDTSFASPRASWRTARTYGRVLGLMFGLLGGLFGGLVFGLMGWWAGGVVDRAIPHVAAEETGQLSKSDAAYLASHHINATQEITRELTTFFSGPLVGLSLQPAWMLLGGLFGVLLLGLAGGLIAPVILGTWPSTVASVGLAMDLHTPVRLMDFFEDARERGILRAVGPAYQFRHSQLQDRLAELVALAARQRDQAQNLSATEGLPDGA